MEHMGMALLCFTMAFPMGFSMVETFDWAVQDRKPTTPSRQEVILPSHLPAWLQGSEFPEAIQHDSDQKNKDFYKSCGARGDSQHHVQLGFSE